MGNALTYTACNVSNRECTLTALVPSGELDVSGLTLGLWH